MVIEKFKDNAVTYYYPLFEFFLDNHGLVLLDSDIQEIIYKVNQFNENTTTTTAQNIVYNNGQNSFSK